MPLLEYSQPHILHGQANAEAFVLAEVCQRGALFHSENFEWIQEDRRPHRRPGPDDLKYVEEVMELAYYQREMRTERDAGDADASR